MAEGLVIPVGDFYDCDGSERLTHESPEEAVESRLDAFLSPGCDVVKSIAEARPMVLWVYRTHPGPDEEVLKSEADSLLRDFEQWFDENYGDPEDFHEVLEEHDRADYLPILTTVLASLARRASIWCEEVARIELSAAQVEAMMRRHRPDWFEAEAP